MSLFGVGAAEAGMILVIALILIGPQNFPQVMRQAGRWYRVARAFSNEVMKDVRAAVDEIEEEVKREGGDLQSVRELMNVEQDLRQVKSDFRAASQDAAAAAQGDQVIPRETSAAPTPPPKPKGWWEDRDPSDPFVKLERDRAAAQAARVATQAAAAASAAAITTEDTTSAPPSADTTTGESDRDGAGS